MAAPHYVVEYRNEGFQRLRLSGTEETQVIRKPLENNRELVVELARSWSAPEPLILSAAIYAELVSPQGVRRRRMVQTVRRREITIQPAADAVELNGVEVLHENARS